MPTFRGPCRMIRIFLSSKNDRVVCGKKYNERFVFKLNDKAFEKITRSVNSTADLITNIAGAKEYLAWSDQFEPDFNLIREALKRPYARMDGNYAVAYEIPMPNFMSSRVLAQVLAQRTKCQLLLERPEKALQELTLLNDSRKWLEAAPIGKPMTLIAAMINVAIGGLYVEHLKTASAKTAGRNRNCQLFKNNFVKSTSLRLCMRHSKRSKHRLFTLARGRI